MNNYFATVEEKYNRSLKEIPFAVCGDPKMRHGIVLSKNELAKKAGVLTAISFKQAKEICPNLHFIEANYSRYLEESKKAREIYKKYSKRIIPFGLDEAWIDLSENKITIEEGKQIADLIRLEIKYSLSLSASIGVSDNFIFAKLGSDYKKPDATTIISRENYKNIVWPLPVSDLLFVGAKRKKTLSRYGIVTIGDLAVANQSFLKRILGVAGVDIWEFANGDDKNFKPENDKIKSIGNTITPPNDIHTTEDASALLYLLTNSVCTRLHKHNFKAISICINIKDSDFNKIQRQISGYPTDNINYIFNRAYELFCNHYLWEKPVRAIGISVSNLIEQKYEQLSFFENENYKLSVDIKKRVRNLAKSFGNIDIEKTVLTKDWE